ncbi:hypothetical protein LOTGIDRAFT_171966 [Lottia gigantea]|uniref:Uncharacterized protein n=1 Tax=Lottia gigantea TaxID=225164 RepID=V4AEP8_LOTGI|nr:hypothetical protein LOTGIDRAFT_171966 [Lottia gigantea]ESP02494.1 hypothetical protein LOTGIDRAFT_171966 [Lottia gigantea]
MVTTRPRAHSTSNIKLTLISSRQNPALRSTPELPSMLVGLETTVPQNLSPDDFSTTHRPTRGKKKPVDTSPAVTMTTGRRGCCFCCRRCCACGCQILLVLLQLLIGGGVTGLAFYVEFYYPVISFRETPYWAGLPLLLAGLIGVCFCCVNISIATETGRGCFLKAMCFIFSIIAIFVNLIACVFPGIHLGRIYTYRGLCLLGSIVSLWFVILLWRERYGGFYSGTDTPVLRRRNIKHFDVAKLPPEA